MRISIPKDKCLILFDGICNLCNTSVLFVIKHDSKNKFVFAPLQGKTGRVVVSKFKIDVSKTDSILLYNPRLDKLYVKSSAALQVSKHLKFPLNMFVLCFTIPNFIRNWMYDYVAKNRYKWYGKKDACMIPTPQLKAKFLE